MSSSVATSDLISYYLNIEEEAIEKEIVKSYQKDLLQLEPSEIDLINSTFLLTSSLNLANHIHSKVVDSLILNFIRAYIPQNLQLKLVQAFNLEETEPLTECNIHTEINEFGEILESIHIQYLNTEFSIVNGRLKRKKSKHHLKESGAVYTLKKIACEIVEKTIEDSLSTGVSLETISCLDFACGTGRFYLEALKILTNKYGLSIENVICNNLYAIDIDEVALKILKIKLISLLPKVSAKSIESIFKNILLRNGLIPASTLLLESNNGIDLFNDFPSIFKKGGFDVIFSNPPYYLLKLNKKENQPQLSSYYTTLQNKLNAEIIFFKTSGVYHYSIEGMLNYYQLAIEMIVNLTKNNGQIGTICPSTLFADLTSSKLRKHILNFHKVHFIRFYPESALLFDNVAQSTAIFFMQKKGVTGDIHIETTKEAFTINKDLVKKSFPVNNEIPPIDEFGWKILDKLSKFPKLKDFSFIRNKRGELDLTLFKTHITDKNTGWRLVRGNMIGSSKIVNKNFEYVEVDDFLVKKSKDYRSHDFNKKRLICQQISNIDSLNRLKFIFCEPTDILGNSCNYIVSTRDEKDLVKLSYLLNSDLLNWRFKVSSSNNHINNYEIDELPIVNLDLFDEKVFDENYNAAVCELFGLTEEETNYILRKNKQKSFENLYEKTI